MLKKLLTFFAAAGLGILSLSINSFAQDGRVGGPVNGKINFQESNTGIMDGIINLHTEVFIIISFITALVLGLLLWVMIRYNRKTNPTPSKMTHNTLLEIIWTTIPIFILIFIGFESIKLLYKQDVIPKADMVISATGNQWYWTYTYNDEGLTFDGNMIPANYVNGEMTGDEKTQWDQRIEELRVLLGRAEPIKPRRLLDTDTRVVVPVDTTVKVLVTANDVLHAWTIPAFGFKIDAIPGRTNETWFKAREVGTFYGQCSELCGIRHAFMPIVVEVVSKEDYQAWLTRAKNFYANGILPEDTPKLAETEAGQAAGQ